MKTPQMRVVSSGDGTDEKPEIIIEPGQDANIADQVEQILAESCPDLFVSDDRLVRVQPRDGCIAKVPLSAVNIHDLATRHIKFVRPGDGKVNPRRIISEIIEKRTGERPFRDLVAISQSPFLMDDRIVVEPGYDEKSKIFLAHEPPSGFKPSLSPVQAEVDIAIDFLHDLFSEFCFASEEDKSAAFCAILTSIQRLAIDVAPAIAITAPTPGSGKSALTDICSLVATGRQAPVTSLGKDQIENEKRIESAYLAGDPIIAFDNIEGNFNGSRICQVITQPFVRIRPLGGSSLVTLTTRALVLLNGNHLDIRGDMRRRVVLIRLDPRSENPEQRRYSRNIFSYVREHRYAIIHAGLIIMRAYLSAGAPDVDAPPAAGFGNWDRYCRRPLLWLGFPDPLASAGTLRNVDPDAIALRELFSAWHDVFGERWVRSAEVIAEIKNPVNTDLADCVNQVTADRPTVRVLGKWLAANVDRVSDGMRLERSRDSHANAMRWRICPC